MGGVAGYMDLTVSYSTDVCGFWGQGGGREWGGKRPKERTEEQKSKP